MAKSPTVKESIDALHEALEKSLLDPDLHPVLRANYLGIKKELEALVDAHYALWTDSIVVETQITNDLIDADWRNPDKQVDPNTPHVFGDEDVVDDEPDVFEEVSE